MSLNVLDGCKPKLQLIFYCGLLSSLNHFQVCMEAVFHTV